jgi:hypothetical protein
LLSIIWWYCWPKVCMVLDRDLAELMKDYDCVSMSFDKAVVLHWVFTFCSAAKNSPFWVGLPHLCPKLILFLWLSGDIFIVGGSSSKCVKHFIG